MNGTYADQMSVEAMIFDVFGWGDGFGGYEEVSKDKLERFAALVRAHALREASEVAFAITGSNEAKEAIATLK